MGHANTAIAEAQTWPVVANAVLPPHGRPRWRDFIAMAFTLAWETDQAGTFVFAMPDDVLGWRSTALLGRTGKDLLVPSPNIFDPFAPGPAFQEHRVWMRGADGTPHCLTVTAAPIIQDGVCLGMRGVAQAVALQEKAEAKIATALRRGEVVEQILWQMRQEVLAPRMMQSVLDGLMEALGAAGAMVVDLLAKPGTGSILHRAGADPACLMSGLLGAVPADSAEAVIASIAGHPALVCSSFTQFGDRAGLCVWGHAGALVWSQDDALLASAVTTLIRIVLEHEAIQRELARQTRTDPLTGLLNHRCFLQEVTRRIERLACEGSPGTLVCLDVDHFQHLNDQCGQDAGDSALVTLAGLLRAAVRPSDLVARMGGDEFAIWLDGSDELTAAERAEQFRLDAPSLLAAALPADAPALSLSVGIAARHVHAAESLEDVMLRADGALNKAKKLGRAQWRVSPAPFGF